MAEEVLGAKKVLKWAESKHISTIQNTVEILEDVWICVENMITKSIQISQLLNNIKRCWDKENISKNDIT